MVKYTLRVKKITMWSHCHYLNYLQWVFSIISMTSILDASVLLPVDYQVPQGGYLFPFAPEQDGDRSGVTDVGDTYDVPGSVEPNIDTGILTSVESVLKALL